MQYCEVVTNRRWRTAAILKIAKSPYISEKSCDFDKNLVHCSRYWTPWQSRDQKLKFLKFKMAAAAILNIAFLAITHRPIVRFQRNFVWVTRTACRQGLKIVRLWWNSVYYSNFWTWLQSSNSSIDCLISAQVCTRNQNGMPPKATWQKLQNVKIQDGGRPSFSKSLNHNISVKILSDFDKIWCTTADIEPDEILKSVIAVS